MSWTDERIERLTKMWEGGATASQIAEELGGVSRNAVIGKAHRLGLKARPSPVRTAEKTEAAAPPVIAKAPPPVVEPAEPVEEAAPVAEAAAEVAAPTVADEPSLDDDIDKIADAIDEEVDDEDDDDADDAVAVTPSIPMPAQPRIVSVGPGGFLRQGPGDQQAPIPPAPPRRLVPAKPSAEMADKTSLLDLNDRICRWPMGHPGEPDFHFCGDKVNPGFPYCVEHCGRAYQAQLPRGARRPPPPMPFGGPRVR